MSTAVTITAYKSPVIQLTVLLEPDNLTRWEAACILDRVFRLDKMYWEIDTISSEPLPEETK